MLITTYTINTTTTTALPYALQNICVVGKREDLIDAYIQSLKNRNKNTRRGMARAARLVGECNIEIDNQILAAVYRACNDRCYASATTKWFVTCVRQFLRWLDANDKLPHCLSMTKAEAVLSAARGNDRQPYKPKTHDTRIGEMRTYYDRLPVATTKQRRAQQLRNSAILHMLFSTAIRCNECANLTRAQVLDGLVDEFAVVGKGNKSRVVFLDVEAKQAVQAYLQYRDKNMAGKKSPALWITHATTSAPVTTHAIYRLVKRVAAEMGLAANTSPHMIRHWVANNMMDKHDVPAEVVQTILGHASPATTVMIYAHSRMNQVRRHITRYRAERNTK